MRESVVSTTCRNWMRRNGWRDHRLHCGLFFTKRGSRIRGEDPGTPDLVFVQPILRGYTRLLYVETKSTKGRLAKAQREKQALLRTLGFAVIVAHSLEELKREVARVYPPN